MTRSETRRHDITSISNTTALTTQILFVATGNVLVAETCSGGVHGNRSAPDIIECHFPDDRVGYVDRREGKIAITPVLHFPGAYARRLATFKNNRVNIPA
ncbi:MAG: hypothetical protein AB7H77_07545 [Bdellovibrionales bacterium]